MPPAIDMTMTPSSIMVTGDSASGYTGATLSMFTCGNDPSAGAFIQVNPFPDNFPASNPAHGQSPPLSFNIYSDGIQIFGGSLGTIYYQTMPGAAHFPTTNKTGALSNVVLMGTSGAPGTLTLNGGWKCQ